MAATTPSTDAPTSAYDDRDRAENFPVAMRVLPAGHRDRLRRIYAVVRHIDDLGDEVPGDRTTLLRAFDQDLTVLDEGGVPSTPCLRSLRSVMHECPLPAGALHDLVRANLLDQQKHTYPTFHDLLGYCALSADPVGRLVLAAFDARDPALTPLSDRICSALQVLEHCQDVAEDHDAGRIYLPTDDLHRAGITDGDLRSPRHRSALRAVVLIQVHKARAMLREGEPLLGRLHGWGRLAVAGYLAGGLATAAALDHAHGEVIDQAPRPGRLETVHQLTRLLIGAGGS